MANTNSADMEYDEAGFMANVKVGDVLSLKGRGVSVDLEGKFFRIIAVNLDAVELSNPFNDVECTEPYVP